MLLVLVVLAGTALFATTLTAHRARSAPPTNDPLAARFPQFKRAQTARDKLPTGLAARLRDPRSAGQAQVDPDSSRLIASGDNGSLFIARGGGNACTIRVNAGSYTLACGPEDGLTSPSSVRVFTQADGQGQERVWGLIGRPANLRVELDDGRTLPIDVKDGVFSITVPVGSARSVSWVGADGRQRQARVPPLAARR